MTPPHRLTTFGKNPLDILGLRTYYACGRFLRVLGAINVFINENSKRFFILSVNGEWSGWAENFGDEILQKERSCSNPAPRYGNAQVYKLDMKFIRYRY